MPRDAAIRDAARGASDERRAVSWATGLFLPLVRALRTKRDQFVSRSSSIHPRRRRRSASRPWTSTSPS